MDGDSISDGGSDLTADDILRLFADHVLLDVMKRWPSFEDDPPALGIVIELHNAGRLDLLSVADWPEWDQVSGHRFFDVQHFMDQAIPRLEADTDRMMAFVAALVAKGGNDGAARWPNVALTQWCERHPDQARAIVAKAETGEALAVDHLSFALHALGDLELARSTVLSSVGLRRLAALAGLARISHLTPELRAATVLLFDGLLASDVDDALRSSIANALVNIFDSANEALTAEAVNVVERAVSAGGEATLHSAARALFGNRAPQSIELVTILLIALRRLNSAEKGSVEILDVGLGDLVRRGFGVQAVDFLTEFLSRPDIELPLSEFRNFCASLFEGDQKTLHRAVARWLLSGVGPLCVGIEQAFSRIGPIEQPLAIDLSAEQLMDEEIYFICRKAIGFLFMQPVVAASILISAIRATSADYADAIQELLFEPLLVNYGGAVKNYLGSLLEADPAFERAQQIIARGEAYLNGLRSAGVIKELYASEQHRLVAHIHFAEQINKAMKEAEKKSVFSGLFKRSTLLYGNRSVSFMEGPGGERRRFGVEVKSHGITQEWPRTETIDPVGLEEMLFALRIEQRGR